MRVAASDAGYLAGRAALQVHGAIGFTREHDLRLVTTRLWAWRDEFGTETRWQDELVAAGGDAWWSLVTGGLT